MNGLKNKSKPCKGIIFAGCSFTWGQGLYFYSGLDTIQAQPSEYIFKVERVSRSQRVYAERHRFASQVSNHYGTFDFVRHGNGGSNDDNIREWSHDLHQNTEWGRRIHPSEIGLMVFQMTQPHRDINTHTGCPHFDLLCDVGQLEEYMRQHGHSTPEDFHSWFTERSVENIREFLRHIESLGIPTIVMTWPQDNVLYIKKDAWLSERYMPLTFQNKVYDSIQTMMEDNRDFTIKYDFESFDEPPLDHHPSQECHNVIAQCLITEIDRRGLLNDRRLK